MPKGTKSKYQSQYGWKSFKNIVEMGTDGIARSENGVQPFDVYSLNGLLLKRGATSLEELPKGIYIVGGHKAAAK